MYSIKLCESLEDIKNCFPVVNQLHSDFTLAEYLETTERLMSTGYRLLSLDVNGTVKSVAGFHLGESYAWKKYLYVDDMVTDENSRSNGYGEKMLEWIEAFAHEKNCKMLHLDSRVIRHAAHKFYINHGLVQGGYHFHKHL